MQSEGGFLFVGRKNWWDYWGSKYKFSDTNNSVYPLIASTTDKVGSGIPLVNTSSWRFDPKYTEGLHMGNYDSDELERIIEEAEVIKLE